MAVVVPCSMGKSYLPLKPKGGIHQAIEDCRFSHVQKLVDYGLGIRTKTVNGRSVLITAMRIEDATKREKMFNMLLRRDAACDAVELDTGRDVLGWAAYLGRRQEAEKVLKNVAGNVDLHRLDKYGYGALHYAVMFDHIDVTWLLCKTMRKFNISVDYPDSIGVTPYIYAKRKGESKLLDILVTEGGASPGQLDPKEMEQRDYNPLKALITTTKRRRAKRQPKANRNTVEIRILPPLKSQEVPNASDLVDGRKTSAKLHGHIPDFISQRKDLLADEHSNGRSTGTSFTSKLTLLPSVDKSLVSSMTNISLASEQQTSVHSCNTIDTNISEALPRNARYRRNYFGKCETSQNRSLSASTEKLAEDSGGGGGGACSSQNDDVKHLLDMVALQIQHNYNVRTRKPQPRPHNPLSNITLIRATNKMKHLKVPKGRTNNPTGKTAPGTSPMSKMSPVFES